MKNRALVVGGTNGIGAAVTLELLKRGYEHVYIVGKTNRFPNLISPEERLIFSNRYSFHFFDLLSDDYSFFDSFKEIDTLVITAGFGRVAPFENLQEPEIVNLMKCDALSVMRILNRYYDKIQANTSFYCAVLGSIAGHVASPMFSVYSAAKSALCRLTENLNAELASKNCLNRILDVSPGNVSGTSFYGEESNLPSLSELASEIVDHMLIRDIRFIPQYDEIYSDVLHRYASDPIAFAAQSCQYKLNSNRISTTPQLIVGYLSGTFDLFHIGHLNLLRRAKEHCDHLIVGVHRSGAWKNKETFIPFEERLAIVQSIRYVDQVIESYPEDSEAYDHLHFDRLFVGSDYKGTERFTRYERYFADKNVSIIYFPYTQGTSSTQLRKTLSK